MRCASLILMGVALIFSNRFEPELDFKFKDRVVHSQRLNEARAPKSVANLDGEVSIKENRPAEKWKNTYLGDMELGKDRLKAGDTAQNDNSDTRAAEVDDVISGIGQVCLAAAEIGIFVWTDMVD